jgi:hypothetical protein
MAAKITASIALLAAIALGGYFLWRGGGQDADAAAASARLAVPDALSVSTPETRALPGGMRLYESKAFKFSIAYPEQLKVTQYEERGNAMTVTFENPDRTQEFEVYVTPYAKAQIDDARFKLDQPSGRFLDPQDVVVDGARATLFTGYNAIMGDTREVWFIKDGFLYEVMTYKPLDAWLGQMMQGWKFI